MSLCDECGKMLASATGLRRHINSQHQKSESYKCECGKRFLDPARRSRCRASHSKSFGCPAEDCNYRSDRKDSTKQHMRRRHRGLANQQVVTLPPRTESSTDSSGDEFGLDPSPSPDPVIATPPILQPQLDVADLWPSQPSFYYSQMPPDSWPVYEPFQ